MGLTLKPRAPKKVNGSVKKLIAELGLKHPMAKFLSYTHRSASYRAAYCFNNCEEENKNNNCEVVYGWVIWEDRKKSFVEAEFHAVIKEKGKLLDISPRQDGEKIILFIADKTRLCGRKSPTTWASWSNLKMVSGMVIEEVHELEVIELNHEYSEVRRINA